MRERLRLTNEILSAIKNAPVTAILGPRQCGKTTLSKVVSKKYSVTVFDLEDPLDFERLTNTPKLTLEPLKHLVIIDEIQRIPELFKLLRVLSDKNEQNAKFLILGSASPDLIKNASESLSGRISFIDMSGFTIDEVKIDEYTNLWIRGGFPRSFLAEDESASYKWRENFIRTFLERDIPQLGINIPMITLRRFWTMIAHYHGQIWNGSEFARAMGISEPTARRYLDLLSGAYVVRQVPPWFENLKKRQVKSPKIYIRDSGLLHVLLSLDENNILSHPKAGSSWEGFVIEQIISITGSRDYYFWATHAGAELDFLLFHKGKRIGFEIKNTDVPKVTKSMLIAKADLALDLLYLVYPGQQTFQLNNNITAVSITDLKSVVLNGL
ncbi:MAG: ATP-binding protein [Bacteroidetes bacterium]|nr:ATP-binding protein [Bacteroidota bacterium]